MDKGEDPVITNDTDIDDQNTATQAITDKSDVMSDTKFDTDQQNVDQSAQNESPTCTEKQQEQANVQIHESSTKSIRHWGTARRHETIGYILFLVAMVTICQGLGFFAASCFGESVPFLSRDPIVLIGVMYTVMGLGFLAISRFCHNSKAQSGDGICKCIRTVPMADIPPKIPLEVENSKKTN